MVCKNGFLFLIMIVAHSPATIALAQSKGGIDDIDFSRIFNTQYTCIGIPIKDSVYIYAPPSLEPSAGWSPIDSLAIPEGTVERSSPLSMISNTWLSYRRNRLIFMVLIASNIGPVDIGYPSGI
ncbi:hypothetical protein [Parapedobacter sp.]